jgi:hypothetical protein
MLTMPALAWHLSRYQLLSVGSSQETKPNLMASFLIDTANQSVVGTPGNDQFVIQSGAEAATVLGAPGDDILNFNFSNSTGYTYVGGRANGNEGDDEISLIMATGGQVIGNYFGGGKNNDSMSFTAISGHSFFGNTLHGGMGNDTILVSALGVNLAGGNTINGNEGNDLIIVSASASGGSLRGLFVGGGQGEDIVRVDDNGTSTNGVSINGGLGSDRIFADFDDTASNIFINGGTFGTTDAADSDDSISLSADEGILGGIVAGNAGNDSITVDIGGTALSLRVNGNSGDDFIHFSADGVDRTTVGGGAGNDTISYDGSAEGGTQNSIIGGDGDDSVIFSGGLNFSASDSITVQGGAGADFFSNASAGGDSNDLSGGNFSYASLSDSTMDTLDTIQVGTGGGNGSFMLGMPQSVDVFNGNANGLVFTAGILDNSTGLGTGNLSLSFILTRLDGSLAEGDAVAFRVGTATQSGTATVGGYVFTKGAGGDNFLLGFSHLSANTFSAGDASLVNAGANTLDLTIT